MIIVLFIVLTLSVVLIVVGALAKGLVWLLAVGTVIFAATTTIGIVRRHTLTSARRQ